MPGLDAAGAAGGRIEASTNVNTSPIAKPTNVSQDRCEPRTTAGCSISELSVFLAHGRMFALGSWATTRADLRIDCEAGP